MEAPRDVPSKASRPVLSGRGRPLPASLFRFTVRARVLVHSLHCLLARAPISLVVVAHSVPGGLNLFDCSLELQAGESSVSQACARYIMFMYIPVHAALQAPCRSAGSFRCKKSLDRAD